MLWKIVAGLIAGCFAGALVVAFLPRIQPSAASQRAAVEQPVFVAQPVALVKAKPAVGSPSDRQGSNQQTRQRAARAIHDERADRVAFDPDRRGAPPVRRGPRRLREGRHRHGAGVPQARRRRRRRPGAGGARRHLRSRDARPARRRRSQGATRRRRATIIRARSPPAWAERAHASPRWPPSNPARAGPATRRQAGRICSGLCYRSAALLMRPLTAPAALEPSAAKKAYAAAIRGVGGGACGHARRCVPRTS